MDLPLTVNSTQVTTNPVISLFFCMGPCAPKLSELIQSFNSHATVFMSLAARSIDLDDQKPGINIQTEGHTLTPTKQLKWPWEDQRGIWRVPHPNHCPSLQCKETYTWMAMRLSIVWKYKATSTKDERVITPPLSHAWQVPIVEDMVWDGKAGLTEAVVTGPGWAVLFYRCSSH